jgi:hypothetical protein
VGFKVSRNGTNLGPTNLNYFEFKTRLQGESLIPVLKRDINEPHIIATDEGFNFPKDPSPLTVDVPGFLPVKIYKFKGGIFEPIGGVFLTHNSQNHTIKFCIENPVHWNPNYSFSVLTATSATGLYEAESRDSSNEHNISELKIKENPFSETITINNIPSSSNMGILSVKLINMLGRIQYSYNYENYQNEISIPTAFISPGTYFIQVQYSNKTQIFKLIKQN